MDTASQIKNRADEYAKRMLLRQRQQNMSPENQSKSLRRRISIMDALKKSYPTSPSNLLSTSNPFAKEFSGIGSGPFPREDHYLDKSKPDGIDLSIHEELNPTPITSSPVSAKLSNISGTTSPLAKLSIDKSSRKQSLNQQQQPDKNLKNREEVTTQEEPTKYFTELAESKRLTLLQREIKKPDPRKSVEPKEPEEIRIQREEVVDKESRFSLGEYFHGKQEFKGEELIQPNFNSDLFEEEFRRNEEELKSKGADAFFAARVLEVIEPNVEQQEWRDSAVKAVFANNLVDLTYVQEELEIARRQAEIESNLVAASFASEEMRQLDQDIRLVKYERPVLLAAVRRVRQAHQLAIEEAEAEEEAARMINETPKRLYPDLTSEKRILENFTPKKLFHAGKIEKDPDVVTDTIKNAYRRPSSPEREIFYTPMPIPDIQINNLVRPSPQQQQHEESGMASFLKRNTSFLNNLSLSKIRRHKPNLESTRKNEKTFSPIGQGGSTISTLTLTNTPGSPPEAMQETSRKAKKENQSQQVNKNAQGYNKDATIPYEVENFLELALGDEQYNESVTYANSDAKASVINVTELISEDRTPPRQRIKVPRVPMTEPPKHSSTLNRTLTMYKTFTQRIKNKFRGSVKDMPKAPQQIILPTDVNPNLEEAVKELLEKVKIQQARISQASKALDLCTTMREFSASPERVESERILMVAQLRSKAYLDEIGRLTSQRSDDGLYCERGQISISSISVQLREEALRRDYQGSNFVEWFVLVITEGPTVWATIAVPCPIAGQRMYFPGTLSIPDLPPDFTISVKIYSMKMQNMEIRHEDKYHIMRGHAPSRPSISMGCPSPKRLLRRSEKKTSPKQFEVRFSGIKESSFVLCGNVELFLHDLNLKSPWPLSGLPPRSMLHGTIDLNLTCQLQLSVSHSGFLTHSDDGLTSWNRRWCVLEDRSLLFWNYPREQEYKSPLYTIDLECCVSRRIKPIDRTLCPRARTFAVQTMRKRKETDGTQRRGSATVIRHLLSCDTNQELTEWQSKLNHVVSALREWNIIKETLLPDVDSERYYKQTNVPWM